MEISATESNKEKSFVYELLNNDPSYTCIMMSLSRT